MMSSKNLIKTGKFLICHSSELISAGSLFLLLVLNPVSVKKVGPQVGETFFVKAVSEVQPTPPFKGFKEINLLFDSVRINQGITTDGEFLYVSPDHSTLEKRDIKTYRLIASVKHPQKVGGLFYDAENKEILTCSGEYITGGKAFISRIKISDISQIENIDISQYTSHGVNAIVKIGDKIFVGETAVSHDSLSKSWYVFDKDFHYKKKVYSHTSNKGRFDWQDATVYRNIIYATDHRGYVCAFKILKNDKMRMIGTYDSSEKYMEGITQKDGLFMIWKRKIGIVAATLE